MVREERVVALGRPTSGPRLVVNMEGSDPAKHRLKLILETLAGGKGIPDACAELGIGEAAFHKMRMKALQAALADLEPKPAGRPAKDVPEADRRIAELQARIVELRMDAEAARIREEIALAMPHLLARKKNRPGRDKARR